MNVEPFHQPGRIQRCVRLAIIVEVAVDIPRPPGGKRQVRDARGIHRLTARSPRGDGRGPDDAPPRARRRRPPRSGWPGRPWSPSPSRWRRITTGTTGPSRGPSSAGTAARRRASCGRTWTTSTTSPTRTGPGSLTRSSTANISNWVMHVLHPQSFRIFGTIFPPKKIPQEKTALSLGGILSAHRHCRQQFVKFRR